MLLNKLIDKMKNISQILDKNTRYENFFGDIDKLKEIASYEGVVDEIYSTLGANNEEEKIAKIVFQKNGQSFVRLLSVERLEEIDAAFRFAKIKYKIYTLGEKNITSLQYAGPNKEQMLKQTYSTISESDIEELDN